MMPSCSKRRLESFMPNLSCHRKGGVGLQRHPGDLNESLLKMVPQSRDGYAINLPVQLLEHKRPHANTHTETITLKPQEQRTRERFSLRSHLRSLPWKAETTGQSLWLFDRSHPHGNRSLCFSTGGICTVSLFLSLSRSLSLFCVSQIWITTSFLSSQHKPDRGGYLKAIGKRCHFKKTTTKQKIQRKINPGLVRSALVHPNYMCLKSNRKKSGLS